MVAKYPPKGGPLMKVDALRCQTRRRLPSFTISLLLELHASHVRLREVLRIFEDVRYHEVVDAFILQCRPVFGEHCVRAVRHAVAAEVPGTHLRRDGLQRSVNRLHVRWTSSPPGARPIVLPLR